MKYENKGYPLPDVINPPDRVCITVPVPNDPTHLDNFYGALFTLTRWFNYRENPAKTGKATADVWSEIFQNLSQSECLMPTQYRMDSCGLIEFSVDGGETWETLANFSDCFIWRAPDSDARNVVQSAGNYRTIQFKRQTGQTAPLTEWRYENDTLRAWIDYLGNYRARALSASADTLFLGERVLGFNAEWAYNANNFRVMLTSQNGYAWWGNTPNSQLVLKAFNAASGLQAGTDLVVISGINRWRQNGFFNLNSSYDGTHNALFSADQTSRSAAGFQAISGQTTPIWRNLDATGNELSGTDKYGFLYNRLIATVPGFSDAKTGAMAVDSVNQKFYIKMPSSWVEIVGGTSGITDVTIDTTECTDAPTAEIVGNTLNITIPQPLCASDLPDFPTYYHRERSRPLPGDFTQLEFMIHADEHVVLPWQLANGDSLLIAVMDGWWDDEQFNTGASVPAQPGYEGNGRVMFTGLPGTFTYNALDPSPTEPHMALLTAYHSLTAPTFRHIAENGLLVIEDIDPDAKYAWFQPNTQSIYRTGALHIAVTLYASDYEWEIDLDFTSSDHSDKVLWNTVTYGDTPAVGVNGYGGLGVSRVNFTAKLTGDITTYTTEYIIEGYLVNPAGTGQLYLAPLVPPYSDPAPTMAYGTTLAHIDGPFGSPGFTTGAIGIEGNLPLYPGNAYETYLTRVRIRGTGTLPVITPT